MTTVTKPMDEWNTIPWKQVERTVFKLQKRIYQASARGDVRIVHKLQRLMMKSWHACLLAVRRVAQDNHGKKTAGVDGVKNLNPRQRLELAQTIQQNPFDCTTHPVRRVWIPKPGATEQRPLGIPVMETRARQALVKLGLEPEWEAKFEPNSYGFRPGRRHRSMFQSHRPSGAPCQTANLPKLAPRHKSLAQRGYPRRHGAVPQHGRSAAGRGTVTTAHECGTPRSGDGGYNPLLTPTKPTRGVNPPPTPANARSVCRRPGGNR